MDLLSCTLPGSPVEAGRPRNRCTHERSLVCLIILGHGAGSCWAFDYHCGPSPLESKSMVGSCFGRNLSDTIRVSRTVNFVESRGHATKVRAPISNVFSMSRTQFLMKHLLGSKKIKRRPGGCNAVFSATTAVAIDKYPFLQAEVSEQGTLCENSNIRLPVLCQLYVQHLPSITCTRSRVDRIPEEVVAVRLHPRHAPHHPENPPGQRFGSRGAGSEQTLTLKVLEPCRRSVFRQEETDGDVVWVPYLAFAAKEPRQSLRSTKQQHHHHVATCVPQRSKNAETPG